MVNGIRASDPPGLYKGRVSKFREGFPSSTRNMRWTHRQKRCENKEKVNSPKTSYDKFIKLHLRNSHQ